MKSKQKELTQKTGRSCEWEWYEKVLDAGSTFAGNITGYYDYKKATEGVNPVTGETCLLHIMTSKNSQDVPSGSANAENLFKLLEE